MQSTPDAGVIKYSPEDVLAALILVFCSCKLVCTVVNIMVTHLVTIMHMVIWLVQSPMKC